MTASVSGGANNAAAYSSKPGWLCNVYSCCSIKAPVFLSAWDLDYRRTDWNIMSRAAILFCFSIMLPLPALCQHMSDCSRLLKAYSTVFRQTFSFVLPVSAGVEDLCWNIFLHGRAVKWNSVNFFTYVRGSASTLFISVTSDFTAVTSKPC